LVPAIFRVDLFVRNRPTGPKNLLGHYHYRRRTNTLGSMTEAPLFDIDGRIVAAGAS